MLLGRSPILMGNSFPPLGVPNVLPGFSASATITGPGVATTGIVLVTETGGSSEFIAHWRITSGSGWIINTPDSVSTSFSRSLVNGETALSSAVATITDVRTGLQVDSAPVQLTASSVSQLSASISSSGSTDTHLAGPGAGPFSTILTCNVFGGAPGQTYGYSWNLQNVRSNVIFTNGNGLKTMGCSWTNSATYDGVSDFASIRCDVNGGQTAGVITIITGF